jgi:hypothetical protein
VDASFARRKRFFSPLPEIADLAISPDSEVMACILHGKDGTEHRALLYIARVATPDQCTQTEELEWPATDIVELSFPTSDDIYLVVRPRVNIRSLEETATLIHICLKSKRLESVIIKSQVSIYSIWPPQSVCSSNYFVVKGFDSGANVGLFTTFAPLYRQPSRCAVVTKEKRLYIQSLEEESHVPAIQADIKQYRILKLITGWDKGEMFAIGRHVASHNMILLQVHLPVSGVSDVSITELAQFPGLSYSDQFTEALGNIKWGKYILLAALMSANQRAIYKVKI